MELFFCKPTLFKLLRKVTVTSKQYHKIAYSFPHGARMSMSQQKFVNPNQFQFLIQLHSYDNPQILLYFIITDLLSSLPHIQKFPSFFKLRQLIVQMSSESGDQYIAVDEEMYVVQAIRGKRMIGNTPQYLVKWLNWDRPQDLTWEPLENLTTVKDLVEIFESKRSKKEGSEESKPKEEQLKSEPKKDVIKQKKLIKESDKKKREQKREEERKKERSKMKKEQRRNKQIQISSDSESQSSSSSSSSPEPEKKVKAAIRIGQINHLVVNEKGEKNYEVDMINNKGQCVGIKLVTSKYIKSHEKNMLVQFLQGYLQDEEKWIANRNN